MVALTKIPLLLLATAITATSLHQPQPRCYEAVSADMKSLNSHVRTLSSQIAAYTGGIQGSIPVAESNLAIDSQINKTLSDVARTSSSGGLTDPQCGKLVGFFKKTLTKSIKATLTALVAKKTQFTEAGLRDVVAGEMASHRDGWVGLATGLRGECTGLDRKKKEKEIGEVTRRISEMYSSASAAYA